MPAFVSVISLSILEQTIGLDFLILFHQENTDFHMIIILIYDDNDEHNIDDDNNDKDVNDYGDYDGNDNYSNDHESNKSILSAWTLPLQRRVILTTQQI